MKRSIIAALTFFSIMLLAGAVSAQEAETTSNGWEKSLDLSLNVTQSSYSDSWIGGEAGNVTWVSDANGIFAKQMSPKFHLKNSVKLAFGQTMSQDKDSKKWSKPAKSTDEIDLEAASAETDLPGRCPPLPLDILPYFAAGFGSLPDQHFGLRQRHELDRVGIKRRPRLAPDHHRQATADEVPCAPIVERREGKAAEIVKRALRHDSRPRGTRTIAGRMLKTHPTRLGYQKSSARPMSGLRSLSHWPCTEPAERCPQA